MANLNKKKPTIKQRVQAVSKSFIAVYKFSPIYFIFKIVDIIFSSLMPLATTYFAAATTTSLAEAYDGNGESGKMAIIYMITTAAIGVISLLWTNVRDYVSTKSRYKINIGIENQLYDRFLNLDFWRYDDKNTADLFDKSLRFSNAAVYIFDSIIGIVSGVFTLVISIIALSVVGWWLCVILLVSIIPGLLIQIKVSRMQMKHWKDNAMTRRAAWRVEKTMMEPSAIAELKIYGVIKRLIDLKTKYNELDEKVRIDFERKYMGARFGSSVLEALAELTALIFTTFKIINRSQPVGQFLYVQQLVSRSLSSASGFVMKLNSIDEDVTNLFDYYEFMELPIVSNNSTKLNHQPDVILIDNVDFRYPNSKNDVLRGVSLKIDKGQHIAIVGENGAGKTTLIKLILGLYNPTKGEIKLDDYDLRNIDVSTWHNWLGVLQQDFVKYSFATVEDNIYMGNVGIKNDRKLLERAIEAAEAKKFIDKLPKGLDTYIDKWMGADSDDQGTELSGGQWQRLALARNFYRNSPIVILDEPTSAIDALAESRIFERLFANKEITVITISHRLTTVEKADVIYMLENGEIVERGSHKELVFLKGKYYNMFKSQLHESEK